MRFFLSVVAALSVVRAQPSCKSSPFDPAWPSAREWSAFNKSIDGTLIRTAPAASACYPGNPFNVSHSCNEVKHNWTQAAYQAKLPEGIDSPLYANNSCLPPGAEGYNASKGCAVGGYPAYIVNAATETQIATAMAWASQRNLRIVVKGTGHDLNGRSSGAYALSIWTHNLQHLRYEAEWLLPDGNGTREVIVAGSGNTWAQLYRIADQHDRVVVGGGDGTVGLGGYLQGGGHGPLSSQFGLGADQILQATVITTDGRRLVAGPTQHKDLFWAVKGGGAGQYGVVTEYVLQVHPAPRQVVSGSLQVYSTVESDADRAWDAVAAVIAGIPDMMDEGIAGTVNVVTGSSASTMLSINGTVAGAAVISSLTGYYVSTHQLRHALEFLAARAQRAAGQGSSIVTVTSPIDTSSSFLASFGSLSGSNTAGAASMMSTRLLGRAELSDLPRNDLSRYLRRILYNGSILLFGLQGGPGPANVPDEMRGAVNPIWRRTYAHVLSYGVPLNATDTPSVAFAHATQWAERYRETVWREWAPATGAYMNEANPFDTRWKQDFYGDYYDRLLAIKDKYDPTASLYVLNGVGSDRWNYNLDSGRLCRVGSGTH